MLTSSKSTRDRSVDGPSAMNSLQRTSNAELRSQGLVIHEENLATLEDVLASHGPKETDVDGDVKVAVDERFSDEIAGDSGNLSLFEEYIRDKKCDVAISTEANSYTAPSSSEVVYISEEQAATCGDSDQAFSSTEVDLCDAHSMPEVDILEEHAETCDDDQIPSSIQTDSCSALTSEDTNIAEEHTTSHDNEMHSFQTSKPIEGTFCVPDPSHEFEADIRLSCEQETESPMSVLEVAFLDDPASPVKHTLLDDSSLKPRILHLNDADVSTGTDGVQETDSDDLNGLQVDPAHEVEFNYVKDIFKKCSSSNETLFDEWYSQNIAALQEDDCQHYEAAAAAFDFTDMSADQLLLFDLTNEALLDIYKKHSVSKSKLSWFSSFNRPKPVGRSVLKELWSKVSCLLDEQPRSSIEVDTILSSDLTKSDRWVNFQIDADHLGNKLADYVFDKLLTEFILQAAEF
uniref:DUF4378 domain-containing protein n=1 Tax=Arundo donax TaxID=35708 RepID=A0A0A9DZU7_ARUDO